MAPRIDDSCRAFTPAHPEDHLPMSDPQSCSADGADTSPSSSGTKAAKKETARDQSSRTPSKRQKTAQTLRSMSTPRGKARPGEHELLRSGNARAGFIDNKLHPKNKGVTQNMGALTYDDGKGNTADIATVRTSRSKDHVDLSATAIATTIQLSDKLKIELEGGKANAHFHASSEKSAAGATANLLAGAVAYGKADKTRSNDEHLRIGGSVGAGMALRLHHSDEDKDGRRELGFGFDIGNLSFDIKSENWLQSFIPALRVQHNLKQDVQRAQAALKAAKD